MARAYEAIGPFGLYTARVTYLIDSDGLVMDSVRADLRLAPHERFIGRALGERDQG